jgi:outer membrane protein assembly factor BamD
MARPLWLLATVSLALAPLGGCGVQMSGASPRSLTYTEDARKAYEEAMVTFREKDWEGAKALFAEVKKRFPQSRYARLAELRLADIDFALGRFPESIGAYRSFVTTYRTDREVEYARYRLAKALFFDISDTVLQPPAEERDQATTADAQRELRAFLRAFPRSRYKKDVDFMLEVVTGRLARHELYVARYYVRRDNYEAALARIEYALAKQPNSGLEPEALVMKGETLMRMNRRIEAKSVFESVIRDWGGPFSVRAKAYLDELASPSQPPPIIRRPTDPGPPVAPAPAGASPSAPSSALPRARPAPDPTGL